MNMPAAEVEIDEELVRGLLREQHPDLAGRSLRLLANGWDNVLFRLGEDLTVRLPRRELSVACLVNEQRWLPVLAPRLPLPTPAAVRIGRPSTLFPWPWTVGPWLPGTVAARTPPDDPFDAAETLGAFLVALHRPAPPDAPHSPYRGVPLADRDPVTRERIGLLAAVIDGPAVSAAWDAALAVAPFDAPKRWVHGDLHPANVLVDHGRLSAVIDFGDITGGDPATDLMSAWMFFGPDARAVFRAAAGGPAPIDDDTWDRARGWALMHALACLASSADNAMMSAMAQRTLAAVLADPRG